MNTLHPHQAENPTNTIHRRGFLSIAAGIAAATAFPESAQAQQAVRNISVDSYLKAMEAMGNAKQLPGIAHASHISEPTAKYGLTHIRQSHWIKDIVPEEWNEVRLCQEEILHLLLHMRNEPRIRLSRVFLEGYRTPFHYKDAGVNYPRELMNKDIIGMWGAPRVLSATHNLPVLTAEDPNLHERMGIAEGVYKPRTQHVQYVSREEFHDIRYRQREDAMLPIAKNATDKWLRRYGALAPNNRTAFTVYGSVHDWTDNIQTWNKRNPNDKFSLLMLTPKAVAEVEEQKKKLQITANW
jgi:hypothetical protein